LVTLRDLGVAADLAIVYSYQGFMVNMVVTLEGVSVR